MIFEFVSTYWYLFAMLAVILLLLAFDPASRGAAGAKKVSALQLPQLQNRESAVVVDVNEVEAFRKGHIEQSINLPFSQFKDNLKKLNKHKSKPIVITCQSGARASKAASILRNNEFQQLYILEGGLAAWRKENLPLVKS